MSPQKQRIAIAEVRGWKPTVDGGICWDAEGNPIVSPPDYLNDMNAIRDAVISTFSEDEIKRSMFCYELFKVLNRSKDERVSEFDLIASDAGQWSEAFMRTIGKWEEGA